MTNPNSYDEYNPPTQEFNPQTPYGSGLAREAYNTQRAYANHPDADFYQQAEPQQPAPQQRTAPKKPSGLAAVFDVNKLSTDIVINSVITGILAAVVGIIAELILAAAVPADWPLKQFGVPFWCAFGFVVVLVLVGAGFLGAALDGKSNSDSLYTGLVWAFVLLGFLLIFFLPLGLNLALVSAALSFVPMVATLLRVQGILDNNRLENLTAETSA